MRNGPLTLAGTEMECRAGAGAAMAGAAMAGAAMAGAAIGMGAGMGAGVGAGTLTCGMEWLVVTIGAGCDARTCGGAMSDSPAGSFSCCCVASMLSAGSGASAGTATGAGIGARTGVSEYMPFWMRVNALAAS